MNETNGKVSYKTAGIVLTACTVTVVVVVWITSSISRLDLVKIDRSDFVEHKVENKVEHRQYDKDIRDIRDSMIRIETMLKKNEGR